MRTLRLEFPTGQHIDLHFYDEETWRIAVQSLKTKDYKMCELVTRQPEVRPL